MRDKFITKLTVLATLIITVLSSCANRIPFDDDSLIPINITTKIQESGTRVTDTAFEEGDAVGLYVLESPNTMDKERWVDNLKFTYSVADDFLPETTAHYSEEFEANTLIAYHPYKKKAVNKGETTLGVSIKSGQSDWNSFSASDFLVAENKDVKPAKTPVNLAFRHKMHRINLRIKAGDGYTVNELLTANPIIKLTDVYTKATYDFVTDKFTNHATVSDVIPYGTWKIEGETLVGKSAILVPQTLKAGQKLLYIEIGGRTFEYAIATDVSMDSGGVDDYDITIAEQISLKIAFSITGWGTPVAKDVEAKETQKSRFIRLADLPFMKTKIYDVVSEGKVIVQICKEYLNVDKKLAIVAYPVKNGSADLKNGLVLKYGQEADKNGGKIVWEDDNTYTHTVGTAAPYNEIYISDGGGITSTQSENSILLQAKEHILTDVRGTETSVYPVVKIGTQYWMGSNLEATKYTNGENIPTGDGFGDTAAKYCTPGDENIFYNAAVAANPLLYPEGWRNGNEKDWSTLKAYVDGKASALKTGTDWNQTGVNTPTNLTGFGAIVTGFYSGAYSNMLYAMYWRSDNTNPALIKNAVAMQGGANTNSLNDIPLKDGLGLSIRCIKK